MKKIKFISFIILVSMVVNTIFMAVPSKAAITDPAPTNKPMPWETLVVYANDSVEANYNLNNWFVNKCYDIEQARDNNQEVEIVDGSNYGFNTLNNNILDVADTYYYLMILRLALIGDSNQPVYNCIRNIFSDKEDFELNIKLTLSKNGTDGYETKINDVIETSFSDTSIKNVVDIFDLENKIDMSPYNTYEEKYQKAIKECLIANEIEKVFGTGKELMLSEYDGEYSFYSITAKHLMAYDEASSPNGVYDANASKYTENSSISNIEISVVADGKTYYQVLGYDREIVLDNAEYAFNVYWVSSFDELLEPPDVVPTPEPPEFSTKLDYEAYIDEKDVGGTITDGTFLPNYDKDNIKKDADVTAIITSETEEGIAKVDGKDLKSDGTPNEDGWYYINPDDKTQIAKQYKFDDYDNSTDNGMVKETVVLTGTEGNTDEQTVSIKWPFRIIDVTYDPEEPDENDNEVTVTVETNLPIDPEKVPEGWSIVPNTDNHKITITYKKGDDIDEDITVYQNGTGDSDDTNIKYDWPMDNTTKDDSPLPDAGEVATLLFVVLTLIGISIISKKKLKIKK